MRVLLRGGPVYSPTPAASAMLVVDGVIAWIGPDRGLHADTADRIVDLDGALVTPAFVDSHVHHTMTGMALLSLDLRGTPSREQLLAQVAAAARDAGGRPVLGHGWDETPWPDPRPPTRSELDRASGGAVVYLSRVDAHSAAVSSALIADLDVGGAAGLREDGVVTGAAHARARRILTDRLPGTLRTEAQRAARRLAAARGIAALHEAAGPQISGEADLAGLLELAASEPGPEVVAYWGAPGPARALDLGAAGAAGDLFVDGSLGSRTAWLSAPYADDPTTSGVAQLDVEAIAEHLVAATMLGVQAGFHAIGDAAVDAVVAGVARAMQQCGRDRVRAARHRVEHLTMAAAGHADVLADAGVVASVQPSFDALWGGPAGGYAARLGPQRARATHDFAGLVRAGVSLAFGSDSPVTALEPWEWVRAAVWHHEPTAALSARAAFAAATRGGWRAARRDDVGVLAAGAPATFAVWEPAQLVVQAPDARVAAWSTDPRSGTPGLPRLDPGSPAPACLATVLDGRPIHLTDSPVGAGLAGAGIVAP